MSRLPLILSLALIAAPAFAHDCQLEVGELTRQEQRYAHECASFDEGKLLAACKATHEAMESFRNEKSDACARALALGSVAPKNEKTVDMTGLRARLWQEFLSYMHMR